MKTLQDFKREQMKNPAFARVYQEMEPERNIIRAMVEARIAQNLTQKEVAEKTGIAQAELSRMENGLRNPSIKLLQRFAEGLGLVLKISFEPKQDVQA